MSENLNEQSEELTKEAEDKTAVAEATDNPTQNGKRIGKFPDPEQLYKAYRALEAAFTKRCQEFKSLQQEAEAVKDENHRLIQKLASVFEDEEFLKKAVADERVVQAVLKEYLKKRASQSGNVKLLSGGTGFSAAPPVRRPKTLEEAKRLAEQLLK